MAWSPLRENRLATVKYAKTTKSGRSLLMHHAVLGKPPSGKVIHHKNGNGLDNRRINLEVVTQQKNSEKRHPRKGRRIPRK